MKITTTLITIFIVIDIVLLAVFIIFFIKGWQFRPDINPGRKHKKSTLTLREAVFKDRWNVIIKEFNPDSLESIKLAIIDADKLVDDALKQVGLPGEHMADRLEHLDKNDLNTLQGLWIAHRLRNNIIHTPGFEISLNKAQNALAYYEAFLREIGVLPEAGSKSH